MDDSNPKPLATPTNGGVPPEQKVQTTSSAEHPAFARGSSHTDRLEHSVMEGLPPAKAERVAAMRRELAELQRQLISAQERIAAELQGRAEDAERIDTLEAHLEAQEAKGQQDAKRAADLEAQIADLLTRAAKTAEELRRDIVSRDTQIEEVRRQHGDVTKQFEAESSSLREAKTQLEKRDAELAAMTAERDTEQATKSRLERELDDERKQHREIAEQLDIQSASLRDTRVLVEMRDKALAATTAERDAVKTELAATTAERDTLKAELEQVRRDLDAARGKARDIASQVVRLVQDLSDGGVIAPPRGQRSQPPPLPQPKPAAPTDAGKGEMILELDEAKPSGIGTKLLMVLGGVIVGFAVSIATVKLTTSSSSTAANREDLGAPPPAALAAPVETQPTPPVGVTAEPAAPSGEPTPPTSDTGANSGAKVESATPPSEPIAKTDGVIVLPEGADGHRLFVDGKVIEVKGSRAVVPCGAHEVRIGSRGTARTINVACGAVTAVPADMAEP